MRRVSLAVLVFAASGSLLGCWSRSNDEPAVAEPTRDGVASKPSTPTSPPATAERDAAVGPSYAVMQKVCASSCAGPFARVAVFRDEAGAVAKLRFDGDLDRCSHPPRIYFDAEGNETLTVANEPVVAGSPEAEAFAAKQAAELEGLDEAETLSCFDAARCEAERIPEGMRSTFECRSDSDCLACECMPVNRGEWERRGGAERCEIAGEECVATNPACCDGRCVLAY